MEIDRHCACIYSPLESLPKFEVRCPTNFGLSLEFDKLNPGGQQTDPLFAQKS